MAGKPRKRSAEQIAKAEGHLVSSSRGSHKGQGTATKDGGAKPLKGKQRGRSAQTTARNAKIVKMRDMYDMSWADIAAHFKCSVKTARRGYDAHIADREYVQSFEEAVSQMRHYVTVVERNRSMLSLIAQNLKPYGAPEEEPAPSYDVNARISAVRTQTDLIFKEIALRQAIGDLPALFGELVAARNFEAIMESVLALLEERGLSHEVFLEIADLIEGRMSVVVPKTHLMAVGEDQRGGSD